MLVLHILGTPAIYAYLFFVKYRAPLVALTQQELADAYKEKLESNTHLQESERAALVTLGTAERVDANSVLPGYMRKLTGGYEYRTYWFELFELARKVLLVGVPATFPSRGGNAQLVWGLSVCFITFGGYMMLAPFVNDSDDQLQQLSQFQIFLTLVASIGLRMTPPDATLGTIVSVCFFILPVFAIFMETPLADELRGGYAMLAKAGHRVGRMLGRKKGVYPYPGSSSDDSSAAPASPRADDATEVQTIPS